MSVRNTKSEQARRAGKRPQDIPMPQPKSATETKISLSIRKWINTIGIATRVHCGSVQIGDYWIQMADPGTSDSLNLISVYIPGHIGPFGIFLACEVKKPGGKVSQKQLDFIARVNQLGGIALWADSLASAKAQLKTALQERGLELWSNMS